MIETTIKGLFLLVPSMLGVVKAVGAMAINHYHKSLNEGDILIICE
jgi:hypothetical protein